MPQSETPKPPRFWRHQLLVLAFILLAILALWRP